MGQREYGNQHQGRERYRIVEYDKPSSSVSIEQRAGDRTHHQAGKDAAKGRPARQRCRPVGMQREQHQNHTHHRLRDSGDLHSEQKPPE
jgi:hypothetical protein